MKFILYFSFLFVVEATINVCIPPPSDATTVNLDDVLNAINDDIVEKIKQSVNETSPNLQVDHIDLNITHPAIDILGTLDDIKVFNLLNYDICFLDNIFVNSTHYQFDPFNITFKNLRIEGKYNITGDLGDVFDIFGAGDFWMQLSDFSLAMYDFTFNVTDEICFPINFNVNLMSLTNHFYNFMNDPDLEDLLNGCITSIVPEVMQILWGEWKDIFDKPLEDAINDMLHHHDVPAILASLTNKEDLQPLTPKFCLSNGDTAK